MIAHQKLLQIVERRGHPREIVEALLAAGADREYFADKDKLDSLAARADDADADRDRAAATRSTTAICCRSRIDRAAIRASIRSASTS